MQAAGNQHIEKLTDENYEAWKMQMKSVLVYNDLWGYVSGAIEMPKEEDRKVTWKAKDDKALALIVLSVSKAELGHIRKCEISKDAWCELNKVHSSKGPVRKAVLYRQLYNLKKNSSQSMSQFINEFQQKVNLLEDAGIEIPPELLSIMLLNNLPEDYDNFCVAMESRDIIPSLDFLKGKLIEEEARKAGSSACSASNETNALLSRTLSSKKSNIRDNRNYTKKFEGSCFKCGKQGHRANDCWSKKKFPSRVNQVKSVGFVGREESLIATSSLACSAETSEWCLDSGASAHMCRDRHSFESFEDEMKCEIQTAGKDIVTSYGCGTVRLCFTTKNDNFSVKLMNVLYIPDLRKNLLSVSTITEKHYKVEFLKNSASVYRPDGSKMFSATRKGRMYIVKDVRSHEAMYSMGECDKNVKKWHERYGHLNYNDLYQLKANDMVYGLEFPSKMKSMPCEICDRAKIHVLPFQNSGTRSNDTLGLVHTDICGPFSVSSLGGARYFATFIDDKTRYTEVVFLKSRSDILLEFKKYQLRVEKETGKKIKKLRSDNAKEYISKEFTEYLQSQGIGRQLSVAYTPQQNGVAERANRTIIEMARCMIIQAGLPTSLWAEAVNTAVFLRNKCPTEANGVKTPQELWSGRKPNVKFLRIFGTHATVLKKGPGIRKFDSKGNEAVLVGYSSESKAYRLWIRGTTEVIKSRDVRFIESFDCVNDNNIELIDVPFLSKDSCENSDISQSKEMCKNVKLEVQNDLDRMDDNELDDNNSNNVDEVVSSDSQLIVKANENTPRGRGRPRSIRTGKRGRPAKQYQTASFVTSTRDDNPVNVDDALSRPDKNEWMDAMRNEYRSIIECDTWKLVDRTPDMSVISCKWVFHIKRNQNGEIERYKARLVARGCEQRYGIDYDEIYAPVARMETVRTLLALSVEEECYVHKMDVVTAYIQGDLSAEIYMEQPQMFEEKENSQKVCKLQRPIYGLKQSGREWHQKLRQKLNDMGLKNSSAEPCVFTGNVNNLKVTIVVYVDDLLIACKSLETLSRVKLELSKHFKMKDMGAVNEILGVRIDRQDDLGAIKISQEKYIKQTIKKFGMESCKPASTPMTPGVKLTKEMEPVTVKEKKDMEEVPYRELVGCLVYLANTSRPDLAFVASTLSRFNANPGREHWQAAKHVLRYLKSTENLGIMYRKTNEPLKVYVDADWAGDTDDRKSHTGNVLMLAGGPISWHTRKQKTVACSTMEAEYMALSDASKEATYMKKLIEEMYSSRYVKDAIQVHCDNQSAIALSKENMLHQRSKHIDIKFHYCREVQDNGVITVKYVASNKNIADIFTKGLAKDKHFNCIGLLKMS